MLFNEFWLKNGILRALEEVGYTQPTPIQEQVIGLALKWENVVAQSQTGTGKTAAFVLPLLNQIDTNKPGLQALIMAPTRELVQQITDEIYKFTKYYRVRAAAIYGGASMVKQTIELKRSPTIIIATPWRLMDFMEQQLIDVSTVHYFILDEVDRMLDMGFVRDITKIRGKMKHIKQTITTSATMTDAVKKIITDHVDTYESVKVGTEVTVEKINHSYIDVAHDNKFITMLWLIDSHADDKIIVFTHTKRNTKTIYKVLTEQWYQVGLLNGDLKQSKRMSMLNAFKENEITILVTTDVAARGLNMENVGLVINFDVPQDAENYVHRIGRTWRAGAEGKAIMLVSDDEKHLFSQIEKVNKITLKKSTAVSVDDHTGKYKDVKLSKPKIKWQKQTQREPRTVGDRKQSVGAGRSGWKAPARRGGGWAPKRSFGDTSFREKRGDTGGRSEGRTYESRPSERSETRVPRTTSGEKRSSGTLSFGGGSERKSDTNGGERKFADSPRRDSRPSNTRRSALWTNRTSEERDARPSRYGNKDDRKSYSRGSDSKAPYTRSTDSKDRYSRWSDSKDKTSYSRWSDSKAPSHTWSGARRSGPKQGPRRWSDTGKSTGSAGGAKRPGGGQKFRGKR